TATSTMTNVLYRRVMDWDIEPTNTDEFVTIQSTPAYTGTFPAPAGTFPTPLIGTTDDGFASADPTASEMPTSSPGSTGSLGCGSGVPGWYQSIPTAPALVHNGPCDHGALFDFNFGTLTPGQSFFVPIFDWADDPQIHPITDLTSVGVQLWSLGECDRASSSVCGPN